MADRTPSLMDALLTVHRGRDPRTMLQTMLAAVGGELGNATACCYMLDEGGSSFRLEFADDGTGEVTRGLWRNDLRVPPLLPRPATLAALTQLRATGAPVLVSDGFPDFLRELWGEELAAGIARALKMRYGVVAAVSAGSGPVGLLLFIIRDICPIDVAAECTAHAALALGNLYDRLSSVQDGERDQETGLLHLAVIEQLGARELVRAERYRRALSVVVIEPSAPAASPESMAAAGETARQVMRQPDTVARLDSERLVFLLPETPSGGAIGFIQRLHAAASPALAAMRCSAAAFPQDGQTWDALVQVAIHRLDAPEAPVAMATPRSSVQGGLRGAFPSFGGVPTRPNTRFR